MMLVTQLGHCFLFLTRFMVKSKVECHEEVIILRNWKGLFGLLGVGLSEVCAISLNRSHSDIAQLCISAKIIGTSGSTNPKNRLGDYMLHSALSQWLTLTLPNDFVWQCFGKHKVDTQSVIMEQTLSYRLWLLSLQKITVSIINDISYSISVVSL